MYGVGAAGVEWLEPPQAIAAIATMAVLHNLDILICALPKQVALVLPAALQSKSCPVVFHRPHCDYVRNKSRLRR
jgi:hypothetical protein